MPACQFFITKKRTHPALLHPVVVVVPFAKWVIYFMHCRPISARGMATLLWLWTTLQKWVEAMPTYDEDGKTMVLFLFNHIISRFGIPRAIVTDHGSHFQNKMMAKLSVKLGFHHDKSTLYYPQANGQVEAINKVLKKMLQQMVGQAKSNWHLQLFSTLWAYRTTVKTSTSFTPF